MSVGLTFKNHSVDIAFYMWVWCNIICLMIQDAMSVDPSIMSELSGSDPPGQSHHTTEQPGGNCIHTGI